MSEVTVQEQQLQLVSMVQVVQTSLSKNFTILARRLAHHDSRISASHSALQEHSQSVAAQLAALEERIEQQGALMTARLQDLFRKTQALQEGQLSLKGAGEEANSGVRRVNDELFTTQLQFQDRLKVKEQEIADLIARMAVLQAEQGRISEEVSGKENKAEAERLMKETQKLKDKNNHLESQLKIAHHKIEKMEILSEKAQRMQAKKEVEIFKQIEERVRKEIKSSLAPSLGLSHQNALSSSPNSITKIYHSQQSSFSGGNLNNDESNLNTPIQSYDAQGPSSSEYRRGSVLIDQSTSNSGRSDLYRGAPMGMGGMGSVSQALLEKWSDKMRGFQVQLRELSEQVKSFGKGSVRREVRQNKENSSEGIKDKLNELKPQVVKLWAKVDTLEDRLSFNQRKLQEKLRVVTDLSNVLKENNISRLEEKLKTLQTEIFTSIKQLRGRVQSKVGLPEYQKYCLKQQQKLIQIGEQLTLKSDKLQVKKALLFLQSKIKEIILVISQDEQNEKDALLTKKQLKCMSCDKELDKFSGLAASPKGNWDGMPFKDHPAELLGRCGMTNFGSLAKKIKKLESKQLPVLNKRNSNQSFQNNS